MKNKKLLSMLWLWALLMVTGSVKSLAQDFTASEVVLSTPEQLIAFSTYVNAGHIMSGTTVTLGANIDMTGQTFAPIGKEGRAFSGTFDGQGHVIKNLTINSTASFTGLFGETFNATLNNFTLDNPQVQGGADYTAAVCGHGYATIQNVTIKGGSVKGKDQVGGIAGFLLASTINGCTIDGTVIEATGDRAGGIIGKVDGQNDFIITNNHVKATVKAGAKHGGCGAAGICSQFMTAVNDKWMVSGNIIDVKTYTAGVEEFIPIGNIREDRTFVNGADHITKNTWYPTSVASTTVSNEPGTCIITVSNYLPVMIGSTVYATLIDAVNAVGTGETIKVNTDLEGCGIKVASGKNFTIDFGGHTYTVNADPLAGSTGTKNQAFQLLKDSNIKFMNGTIVADNANIKMLIQNYSNLTLDGMTLDATQHNNSVTYVLSTNNGATTIKDTKIFAKEGTVAFDVCSFGSYTGNTVSVEGSSVIDGKIEVSSYNTPADGIALNINSGDLSKAEITVADGGDAVVVKKEDAVTLAAPDGYVWENKQLMKTKVGGLEYQDGSEVRLGGDDIEIDDNGSIKNISTLAENPDVKITYKRNVPSVYQAWYVPFDYVITGSENAKFYKIWSLNIDANTGLATDVIVKVLDAGEVVKANTPYIIKGNDSDCIFQAQGLKTCDYNKIWCETTERRYTFAGTYMALDLAANPYWALSTEGAFSFWDESGIVENAMRFVMIIQDKTGADTFVTVNPHSGSTSAKKVMRVKVFGDLGDNDVSGIRAVGYDDADESCENNVIYDLSGRRMNTITKSGLYIVNGKKYIMK